MSNTKKEKSLKETTITGMFWSFLERFGSVFFLFISNLILARILTPKDFGLIGMIMVFISISNTFVEGGFSSALIQKKKPTQEDYSTIFIANLLVAFFCFFLLYLLSPLIAGFFKEPLLINLLRVLGLVLILNAFSIIQNTKLVKQINFKKIAKINILSTFFGSSIAIAASLLGFGVWSLVIQILIISFLKLIFYWFWSTWRPKLIFQLNSAKELINYGYKLLISGLIDSFYVNIYTVIIGRVFNTSDLGFYIQAKKMQELPVYTLSGIVNQVTFPIFSKLQDDGNKLKQGVKNSLSYLVFINFPLMIIFIIIAKPLFLILFTEKWIDSVLYFQILCLSGMVLCIHTINLNALKAKGRTDVYLKSETIKKIIGVIFLFLSLKWGIIGMIFSIVVTAYVSFFINAYYSGKIINYGIKEQLLDLMPTFFLSLGIGFVVISLSNFLPTNVFLKVLLQVSMYLVLYISTAFLLKFRALAFFLGLLK